MYGRQYGEPRTQSWDLRSERVKLEQSTQGIPQQTIPFNWTKSWENDLQVLILSDRIQFANKQDIFWGCHVCIWKITNLTENLNYNNHNFIEQGNRLNLRPEVCRYQRKFSLTHYTQTSVCIFSKLLSIHILRCWQGEFV